jgi:N-acetylglucosaminyldiphosphoundecaprenol N-acetyl-beta-D-mannosaminyltransferase
MGLIEQRSRKVTIMPRFESKKAEFLGAKVDLLTMDETLERVVYAMESKTNCQHCVVNVTKLVNMRRIVSLKEDVDRSDIVNIDGMGVLWGARLFGISVPERVTGIDLMERILVICESKQFRPYFLGAKEEILNRMLLTLRVRHPDLKVAGHHHGYFLADDEPTIVSKIANSHADCLFVAMPTPHKERFIATYRDRLCVPFLMGVGGAFDVVSGHVPRAPKWMQNAGLEWFYRVMQEPRRMWRRYLVTNVAYVGILAVEFFRRR